MAWQRFCEGLEGREKSKKYIKLKKKITTMIIYTGYMYKHYGQWVAWPISPSPIAMVMHSLINNTTANRI